MKLATTHYLFEWPRAGAYTYIYSDCATNGIWQRDVPVNGMYFFCFMIYYCSMDFFGFQYKILASFGLGLVLTSSANHLHFLAKFIDLFLD